MTRFVPIVVVVSERTAERLAEFANMPEAAVVAQIGGES